MARHPPRVPVLVRYEGRSAADRSDCAYVRRIATRMLDALGLRGVELSVLLCDDVLMRRLNLQHRRIDKATDVLAFAQDEGAPIATVQRSLGDVAISLPTAKRQARAHGWSSRSELCLLLAHGLLHLLGLDHRTRQEERRMTARTHLLMAAGLGTGRVDKPERSQIGRLPKLA